MPRKLLIQDRVERELCERSFFFFVKWVFKNVYKREFHHNWHHDVICKEMELVAKNETPALLINIPPRYGKTEIAVILFISWCMIKNPKSKFIHTSYSSRLTLDNSNKILKILMSLEVIRLWGVIVEKKNPAQALWYTKERGGLFVTSSEGQVTGFGAGNMDETEFGGALIVDDPSKALDAYSDQALTKTNTNFNNSLITRLNSKKTPIVIIMQRISENDLSGFVLRGQSERTFKHICIRDLKREEKIQYEDPRKVGEALWPRMHSESELKKKHKIDPVHSANQYGQSPSPFEGNIIKKKDLRFYIHPPAKYEHIIISCDLNFIEEGTSNCCFSRYGIKMPNIYLIDQIFGKWEFSNAVQHLISFSKGSPPYSAILVEEKANGPAMISVLRNKGFSRVIAIKVHKSKFYRLSEVSLFYSAHNVYYPDTNQMENVWVKEHIEEVTKFPAAVNDDRLDCETQILKYVKDSLSNMKFYDI